jgi:type II secretory pathway pseudopilin PulG
VTDPIPLFGDETLWWVFNDNGGLHTETGGQQIGMEIQAQAFAYTTTDEINNMTFYNYVLINRGVQTLNDCYFGQWCDPDLGCPTDDYVGCDVQRGLSYTINGDDNDAACDGVPGYDATPPAVGIDFFEGPFQDPDGINNPLTEDLQMVNDFDGIPYDGIGIGYEDLSLDIDDPKRDNVIDNERFGMRRFVYYNRDDQTSTPGINGEPNIAIEFYSYLDGIWKNGEPMTYGGNGVGGSVQTDYMFPALTDPVGFATNGAIEEDDWTEEGESNEPGDRRFIQSAGTFILDPGEFNNITVGVVWARPFADTDNTLSALKIADDKAQSLFDNCFRILSGPDAPDMEAQELNREIILYITNENPTSNNYQESYGFPSDFAFDPLIPDLTSNGELIPDEEHYYEFQGYKIFQLKDGTVSSAELDDVNRARLVAQTDIQDGVGQLVNYIDDPALNVKVPVVGVEGSDEGIRHSFRITDDRFATEGSALVNFRKYYFMAVAYAYNEYEEFNQSEINGDVFNGGQAITYLESRKSANGGIPVITAIPHDPTLENQGTVLNASYGDIIPVSRIEGEGNGGNVIDITAETTNRILNSEFNLVNRLDYMPESSPIQIKVIDPLRVRGAQFNFGFYPNDPENDLSDVVDDWEITDPDKVGWFLVSSETPNDTVFSDQAIDLGGEQLILDYGISIAVEQYEYSVNPDANTEIPDVLEATLTFDDPEMPWLTGVPDGDQRTEQNWIRAGTSLDGEGDEENPNDDAYYLDKANVDPSESYESILGGTVSPWHLGAQSWTGPATIEENYQVPSSTRITDLNNVDITFTSNKANWTRAAVLEIQNAPQLAVGGAEKLHARVALSVDKDGKNQLNGGDFNECTMNGTQVFNQESLDELESAQITEYKKAAWPGEDPQSHDDSELLGLSFGMSWFPGYAIDVESGERLNVSFGENSALAGENGADMLWNPTTKIWNNFNSSQFNPNNARFGGMHYYYVFRNQMREQFSNPAIRMPHYDNSDFIYKNINLGTERKRIFRACTWVGLPLLREEFAFTSIEDGLIPTDALIRLRVAKPYERLATVQNFYNEYLLPNDAGEIGDFPYFYWDEDSGILDESDYNPDDLVAPAPADPAVVYTQNDWLPFYTFSTEDYSASTGVNSVLEDALDANRINVVPNPYYGITSGYEQTRLETKVRIINLPADKRAIIRIYDTGGILVRTIEKDSPATFIDWDLKNQRNVPIAGGVHIFHVEIPGVGEKVVKWFGVMRPIDLDNF